MRIKSIRSQMLIYLLVGLLLLFSLLIYAVNSQLNTLPEHMMVQYQEIVNARADELSNELEKFVQEAKMISQSPIVKSMDLEKIKEYLPNLVLENVHRNMTIALPDGSGWTTHGKTIDISKQEQYKKIFIEGATYWISQPFISQYAEPDIPIIIISHKVVNKVETVGLVNIVISNRFLNEVVNSINLGSTGYVRIVDQSGNVVAHPDNSIGFNRHISEFLPSISNNLTKESWLKLQTIEGKEVFAFSKEIENSPGWTLLLSIQTDEVLNELRKTQLKISLLLVLGIIFMSIFAFYYATSISKPILRLKKVFEEAETGNLTVRADETINNEVGRAAKSFNRMLKQIKKLTYYDLLTNLYNLNGFLVDLPHKAKQLLQNNFVIAIAIVSIDDFKRINSISGYKGGNELLKKLSTQLSFLVKKEELLGRYFGDEFIILLKGNSVNELEERIKTIWEKCSTVMTINENEYRLKFSIGVAVTNDHDAKVEDLLDQANVAKVQAKKQGGNLYQFYDQATNDAIKMEQKVENALYHAISNNELYLVYQPIVDLKLNKVIGTEALIRWKNEQFFHVSPLKLIEIAEKTGSIIEIGNWVLKEALTQNKKWHDLGYCTMFVSVNISTIQFDQPNFIETVQTILQETGMQPQFLELEVTETNAMTLVEEKLVKMSELKQMGIRIAIDDFGTGYSSLAYFTRFPINTLKIDRTFVNEIFQDENAKTIITTIINMAKTINVATTAEGVETVDQIRFLEEQGCDKIQGYLISKPVEACQIEQLINYTISKH